MTRRLYFNIRDLEELFWVIRDCDIILEERSYGEVCLKSRKVWFDLSETIFEPNYMNWYLVELFGVWL